MKKLVLASGNAGKLREFKALLAPLGWDVIPQSDLGVSEADERNWLSRTALGFLESSDPLPPGQTRASQDVIKQYEDAAEAIPSELLEGVQQEQPAKRSWFSRLTFGLFD